MCEELAEKMINSCFFADRELQFWFFIILDSHFINHTISKNVIKPNFPELGIEILYIDKIPEEKTILSARFLNQ